MMDHNGTPRARPGLKFANRVYENSPLNPNKTKRPGTPQTAPSRRFVNKTEVASSSGGSFDTNSVSAARNIFRHSSISSSSSSPAPFSPKLPAETKTKVFAPGNTPNSKRVYREATAQASPRGMMAKSTSADLFTMRIPSPPPEQSGEMLAKRVPSELEAKGSVYADQFLADLVPPEYDDLQRRQLFCVLDLRRLKYSANEVFAKKDWKLNISNFAREYEKSRSLIMLRYGLYEFKNVKPSSDVLRKWRNAHGLPHTEEDEPDRAATPSKQTSSRSSKRKADDDHSASVASTTTKNKKRAFEKGDAPTATPAAKSNNKRKASVSEDTEVSQPSKLQKGTPSATKSLFEQAYNNKPSTASEGNPKPSFEAGAPKPQANPFGAAGSGSVFAQAPTSGSTHNIFGSLSNSAQNSGPDSDDDSAADDEEAAASTQEATQQSDDQSVVASGGVNTPSSLPAGGLFGSQPKLPSTQSADDSRESTPGRSLFDRVTKGSNGQPLRADSTEPSKPQTETAVPTSGAAAAPVNATWNPDSPIKFGSTTGSTPFGASPASAGSGNLFGQKPASSAPSTSLFGAASKEPDQSASGQSTPALFGGPQSQQSDKPATGLFGAPKEQDKPESTTSSLFGVQKEQNKSATASPLFGAAKEPEKSAATPPPSALFGAPKADKPAEESAKVAESNADKAGEADKENKTEAATPSVFGGFAPKTTENGPSSLFQQKSSAGETANPVQSSSTLFGSAKPDEKKDAPAPSSNLFGSQDKPKDSPATGSPTLFGGAASKPADSSAPAASSGTTFSFGNSTTAAAAPSTGLFGQPTATDKPAPTPAPTFSFGKSDCPTSSSAPAVSAPEGNNLFGSPMKQDNNNNKQDDAAPPTKKLFGGSSSDQSAPLFNFGGSTPSTGSNLFGGASAPQTNGQPSTGSGFSFGAGASSSGGSTFNNPFASNGGSNGASAPASGGSPFNFGSSTPNPAAGAPAAGGSSFQFGQPAAPQDTGAGSGAGSSPFTFGGNAPASQPAPATSGGFSFGANTQSQPPSLSFSGSSQPQAQNDNNIFAPKPNPPGGSMFNLQPPGQGASTTGTNSPLNLGGASSLATTPATGTPEPTTTADGNKTSASAQSAGPVAPGAGEAAADDAEATHEQIKLTEGGAGEEDETTVHEVRAKVLKFVKDADEGEKNKSPWVTQGVGPFRLLKHKETGSVRMLLRAEPRGHVAMNRNILPNMDYTANGKYVKVVTSNDDGTGLETFMLQVKTADGAQELAKVMEENKAGAKKGADGEEK